MKQNPIVTIEMENGGVMKLELYPKIAPNTVNNFIYLIRNNAYDGTIFHRVIKGFMIQGGAGVGDKDFSRYYSIRGEFELNGVKNDLKHTRGVLSMARTSIMNSACSQFFIMHRDAPHLDGSYAAFGKLIEGESVLDEIASVQTIFGYDCPIEEQKIKSMTVETFGENYAEPKMILTKLGEKSPKENW